MSVVHRVVKIPDFVGGEEDPRRRDYHGGDEQRGGLLDECEGERERE